MLVRLWHLPWAVLPVGTGLLEASGLECCPSSPKAPWFLPLGWSEGFPSASQTNPSKLQGGFFLFLFQPSIP